MSPNFFNVMNLLKGRDKNLKSAINFIKEYDIHKRNPYFTDLIKCGLEKTREKEKLLPRRNNCIEKFLLKEIKIIQPKLIVCLGGHSHDLLSRFRKDGRINADIELIKLHHYSNRASLTLTIEDKQSVIWPMQFKMLKKEDAKEKALSIKHIDKLINNLE